MRSSTLWIKHKNTDNKQHYIWHQDSDSSGLLLCPFSLNAEQVWAEVVIPSTLSWKQPIAQRDNKETSMHQSQVMIKAKKIKAETATFLFTDLQFDHAGHDSGGMSPKYDRALI